MISSGSSVVSRWRKLSLWLHQYWINTKLHHKKNPAAKQNIIIDNRRKQKRNVQQHVKRQVKYDSSNQKETKTDVLLLSINYKYHHAMISRRKTLLLIIEENNNENTIHRTKRNEANVVSSAQRINIEWRMVHKINISEPQVTLYIIIENLQITSRDERKTSYREMHYYSRNYIGRFQLLQ